MVDIVLELLVIIPYIMDIIPSIWVLVPQQLGSYSGVTESQHEIVDVDTNLEELQEQYTHPDIIHTTQNCHLKHWLL